MGLRLYFLFLFIYGCFQFAEAQVNWKADTILQPLPKGIRLFYTNDSIDGKPNIAYYIEADLKNKHLQFDVDTSSNRRLTPNQFYEKNQQPIVVVNGTFFSFQTNKNLNVVIKNGKLLAYNIVAVQRKGRDSIVKNILVNRSAIGISKKRKADIAWIKTDSAKGLAEAIQVPVNLKQQDMQMDSLSVQNQHPLKKHANQSVFRPWKMQTAIGGGPVLVQNGSIMVTNEYEQMFTGKGILDRHPRTAMGYTKDGKLIIMVVEGRFPNKAEGVTLYQEAMLMRDIGCIEALNLDGGGSSCMLVIGKETIKPSDKTGQRPVPAIFMIKVK